ncbi:MAG: ATP-binding protein [Pseudomonadota bacterium]
MRFSLRLKTILGIAGIEALLLVVLITTVINHMRESNTSLLSERANTTATLFATATKDALLSYDLASLESYTDEVMKNPGVVYARIIDHTGEVFAEAGSDEALASPFLEDRSLEGVNDGIFDASAVTVVDGVEYGRVQVGISTDAVIAAIKDVERLSISIAIVEMLLVALFSYFLGAYLLSELKVLRSAARDIGKGNFEVSLKASRGDEIGDVCAAFNKMVAHLRTARAQRELFEQQLVNLNNSLEQRVVRRTQSLEEKNHELMVANDEIKKTHAQLLQSEKLASVGQLAAGLAHEVNNPVSYVNSNLGSLKEYMESYQSLADLQMQYLETEDLTVRERLLTAMKEIVAGEDFAFIRQDSLELIEDSLEGTARVTEIVSGLKDFAHPDASARKLHDINECITATLRIAKSEIKNVSSVTTELQTLPLTFCHPGQFNQLLLNLIVNARQAIPDSGEIQISTMHEEGCIVIRVSDNGCGIHPEHLESLFNPFFTTKAVGEGTGLGLSISYGIVQDHGGTISVDSTLGMGTTFTISIPVVTEEDVIAA